MTKTAQRPTDTVEETRDQQSPRPNRRRILLMVVAGLTLLSLAALVLGGGILNPAATSEPEHTMTAVQIIPLVILVVMFVVATKWPLNIGVMGLVASFGVGYFMLGMSDKQILEEFPASIVLTIIGVTYFFSMAQRNGTINIIVQTCVRLVRGKTMLLPWVFFLIAAALTSLGTFSPAAVALLAPAALGFAYESRIHPVVMGAFIINGAHAGGFSPLSVAGVLVHDISVKNGFPIDQGSLFAASFALNLILSALTVALFALLGKLRDGEGGQHADIDTTSTGRPHGQQILTLVLIAAMLVCTLGFHMPIGFVALAAGLLLAFVNIKEHQTFIGGISWSTVLLVAGMITYVSLLQHVGVIDTLAEQALALGAPLLIALVLCYVIGVGSAFASSTALLTAFIPLAGPLLASSSLSASGTVAALAIAATVVDVSPFSTDGALVVANARDNDRQRVYKQLMMYSGGVVLVAPALAWALLVPTGIM
ncbi:MULTISPECIES: SLC13 family permease [Micrococcaceae]|uniref:Di/tricarboxylate transporter n=1 Tax=Pseudarthrobacter siccitolerans TaxID=861266 RepID=A0ABU0PQD3_9MICC|nr:MULTISPECIES: SLC13 family permease [Micrococcaceae]MDQ0676160.1 di/tricarboxylate transporter [Pseudarthrobacter siccitolerans]MDQ0692072.1 di/tricarboxylate transporter [Arthrobacter sp. W4I7]